MVGDALYITLGCFALFILAYFIYGRFLARRIFQLDPHRRTPAHRLQDGMDYVPTKIPVLFGHHFASIAGLGPILGPALAVIWGWVPAVLWVVFGCIFMGAVHDLGAMTVSLRFRGRSIGDVCRELIGPRARLLFLIIIFFAMSLAMGAFVNAISDLFIKYYPDAIIPSFGLMVVAMFIGISVYKFKVRLFPATLVGLVIFIGLIFWGTLQPVPTYEWFVSEGTQQAIAEVREAGAEEGKRLYGGQAILDSLKATKNKEAATELAEVIPTKTSLGYAKITWVWLLLGYGFLASVLPVWLLLQPRDYINSFQLYFALIFLLIGLVVATVKGAPESQIHAGAIRTGVTSEVTDPVNEFQIASDVFRPFLPFLFVTIACGAVSGFHSLVSSGTTVRQMNRETDALPIGYGGMLTEGALAILVIMACVAGLGATAWQGAGPYASWSGITGGTLSAVVQGGSNFLSFLRIDPVFGSTFLAVTIVAFALTTLDSATRLLRFNVEELFRSIRADALANRYVASFVAVCGIALFGLVPGGRVLWTLFGTTNQLLAGLTLLTVSIFLFKLHRPIVFTLVPMALMLTFTIWAMAISMWGFFQKSQWLLLAVAGAMLGISLWLLVEAAMSFARGRGGVKFDDEEESEKEEKEMVTSCSC